MNLRLAFALALTLAAAAAGAQTLNGFDLKGASIPVQAIERGGPPKDGIPAIDRPRFVPAARAALADADRVLGLARGGVARAYPVRILNWHEVVNDRIGDEALAVTYCPLCGAGVAFRARLADGDASFGVSGLLYNSDVLLYDRRTESLWSQLLAEAVSGPLKGTKLEPVPISHTTWADWKRRHPGTEVLSTDTGFVRDYERDPYAGYDKVARLMSDVQHKDDRLQLQEWVLGVQLGGDAKAYPFSRLARSVDATGRLRDRVGGQAVELRFDAKHQSAQAFDAQGHELPAVRAFWFAWVACNPKTSVLGETARARRPGRRGSGRARKAQRHSAQDTEVGAHGVAWGDFQRHHARAGGDDLASVDRHAAHGCVVDEPDQRRARIAERGAAFAVARVAQATVRAGDGGVHCVPGKIDLAPTLGGGCAECEAAAAGVVGNQLRLAHLREHGVA
jgi:hypothetical protein